ncbi:MAG: sortase [Clostridia bacterium]|nr:sortase [Clostridia bacterium]
MSDKFSNFLTMILIFFVVAICGIIGYFAYDLYNSNNINSNAQSAIDKFESATQTVKRPNKENKVNNTNTENVIENKVENLVIQNPLEELTSLTQNQVELNPTEETTENLGEPEKIFMEDYEVMGTIEIPKTGVEYPILERVTVRSIEIAVAIAYPQQAELNKVGNVVIYGHNYRNGLFFSNNKKLSNGDKIYITDKYGEKVTYEIYNIYQTTQNDATYFTRDTEGRREISLQTCTDDGDGRIVIWAVEK